MNYAEARGAYADARNVLAGAAYAHLKTTVQTHYPTATGVIVEFEDGLGFLTIIKTPNQDVKIDDESIGMQTLFEDLGDVAADALYEGANAQLREAEISFS